MSKCSCTELKPRITSHKHFFAVTCKHCGEIAIGTSMKEATDAWNKIQHEKKEAC